MSWKSLGDKEIVWITSLFNKILKCKNYSMNKGRVIQYQFIGILKTSKIALITKNKDFKSYFKIWKRMIKHRMRCEADFF